MKEEQKNSDKKSFITVPQLAELLGLSRSQVFRKVQAGQIPAQKVGGVFLIDKRVADAVVGNLTQADEEDIEKAVDKTLKQYDEVLKELGKE